MSEVIAVIGVYGDIHLSSKNYGAHRNYPKESLQYFTKITDVVRNRHVTHLIGLGDFTYGRFHTLEYRDAVEQQLKEQYDLTNGNRYELKGNHDTAGYGMTERDFYISKGLIKDSENITLGSVNLTLVDYGKHLDTEANIIDDNEHINVILAHDYFKFKDTQLPNFGKSIDLDNFDKWFGADYIVCGHVHKIMTFDGPIIKNDRSHRAFVHYLGCMTRPSYREGHMDTEGQMLILTIYDDGRMEYDVESIELLPLDEAFNLEVKAKEKEKKQEKAARVDITDVVKQLDAHEKNVGNPEDIISNMSGIPDAYKDKAIDLLKRALS